MIGGGVAGASIAYHLTELGWQDVLLVDRGELTSGSTFHSAGLVGQLRSSVSLTRMMMYGAELYRRLAAETGVDPGWHEVGSLRLASTDERMQELRRQEGWAHTFGLPLEVISTDDALARFPLFDPTGVQGAAFIPTDGHLDPTNLTLALAEGARRRGAEIRTNTRVTGIDVVDGRVRGVRTDEHGPIAADVVVNAGGMYANQIGRLAGVEVPGRPVRAPVPVDQARSPAEAWTCRRCATRTGSCTSAGRPAAAWSWGATSATPPRGPWTTALPPTSTISSCPTTGSGSSRSPRTRSGSSRCSRPPRS